MHENWAYKMILYEHLSDSINSRQFASPKHLKYIFVDSHKDFASGISALTLQLSMKVDK